MNKLTREDALAVLQLQLVCHQLGNQNLVMAGFVISCVIGTLNVSMSNIIVSQGASKTSASAMIACVVR